MRILWEIHRAESLIFMERCFLGSELPCPVISRWLIFNPWIMQNIWKFPSRPSVFTQPPRGPGSVLQSFSHSVILSYSYLSTLCEISHWDSPFIFLLWMNSDGGLWMPWRLWNTQKRNMSRGALDTSYIHFHGRACCCCNLLERSAPCSLPPVSLLCPLVAAASKWCRQGSAITEALCNLLSSILWSRRGYWSSSVSPLACVALALTSKLHSSFLMHLPHKFLP